MNPKSVVEGQQRSSSGSESVKPDQTPVLGVARNISTPIETFHPDMLKAEGPEQIGTRLSGRVFSFGLPLKLGLPVTICSEPRPFLFPNCEKMSAPFPTTPSPKLFGPQLTWSSAPEAGLAGRKMLSPGMQDIAAFAARFFGSEDAGFAADQNPPRPAGFQIKSFKCEQIDKLRRLYNLLIKIFIGSSALSPDELQLSAPEQFILRQLTRVRFKTAHRLLAQDPAGKLGTSELTEFVLQTQGAKSCKTRREKCRAVFSRAVRHLLGRFAGKSAKDRRTAFCEHYFLELAQHQNLSMTEWMNRVGLFDLGKREHLAAQRRLFAEVFKSARFAKDFARFLQKPLLVLHHRRSIVRRITDILSPLETSFTNPAFLLENPAETEHCLSKVRCARLPWMESELKDAARYFLSRLLAKPPGNRFW